VKQLKIVLRSNLILVTTSFDALNQSWMREFLNKHTRGTLFLPNAVLVFKNDSLSHVREEFLLKLSEYYASQHEFSHEFFLRSMLKYKTQPIKIVFSDTKPKENVRVNLYAYDKNTVLISLDYPNAWVVNYLRSQLEVYVERGTDISLVVDVSDYKAKARLDRALNKLDVLHYRLKYTYDNHFLSTLYSDFASFGFGDLCKSEPEYANKHLYTILECPMGASKEVLKRSYKRLSKAYHPDKVCAEEPHMLEYYTKKFQLLQEAYTTLRAVS
jgi:hypothetical protein